MEHLIDIFARDPNSLSDSDRDRIDALLDEHPGFRDYLDHLREFYRSFRELSAEDVPDHVRAFADSLVRLPRRLVLAPPAGRQAARLRGSGYRFLRADAATPLRPSGPGTLRAAGSLVSTDYGVLLRLIEDREEGELRGYILSPDQNDASNALVRFHSLEAPVPADAAGVVRVPLDAGESADSLLAGEVEIILPVRSKHILPAELDRNAYSTVLQHGRVTVEGRSTTSCIRVRVSGGTGREFLLLDADGDRSLRRLEGDRLEASLTMGESGMSIRLYAE